MLNFIKRLALCTIAGLHRWRLVDTSSECGRMFECRRCKRVWTVRCGVVKK